ncbi:hypothetical protein FM105_13510 [Brevibacterium yomogidense]|uniref:Uncharacterized protein n=1 Tax=Brevibacterium yomogidense TaxID=946573 RepID=A0A1X6XNY1_9MICO|nr:hypothetical protein FM105_13510 [Brevibacterium yomogidense]
MFPGAGTDDEYLHATQSSRCDAPVRGHRVRGLESRCPCP